MQIAALEKGCHRLLDDGPPVAVLGGKPLVLDLLEGVKVLVDQALPVMRVTCGAGGGYVVHGSFKQAPASVENLSANPASVANLVHILTTGAKVSYFYWLRYQYTMDEDSLHDRAYPMLKGTAEFFRNFPGLEKEADELP